jgi:predicted nucleic acid-binding protein
MVLRGPKVHEAETLLQVDSDWAAPYLWRSEMRNLLTGYLRRGECDRETAESLMQEATLYLRAGEHLVADPDVFHLVSQSKCTAYDCEFVALAQALGTRVITEDRTLLREFPRWCQSLRQAIASSET